MSERIYLFDTTLRDGAQTQGVDFSVDDKLAIARALDRLGIDYIEAGWPGANPTDDVFFAAPPAFDHTSLIANGRDLGNVVVQRRPDGQFVDAVHDLTFAFTFRAFYRDGTIHQ